MGEMHPQFTRILSIFKSRYGDITGETKFESFLADNALDSSKAYARTVQRFNESFDWAKPYVHFLSMDEGAKYYAVKAIHAIVSLNNRDYTNFPEMQSAAKSMNYRPININHDTNRWMTYPRTRLDYAKAEDFAVEGILRVDNADKKLQMQLDHDPSIPEAEWISHPSIEGRPDLGGMEKGYHFTALALLEKGSQLPGDPLSEIMPLFAESMDSTVGEVCLFIDGKQLCVPCLEDETEDKGVKKMNESQEPIAPEETVTVVEEETLDEKALTPAARKALPDSAFAYIEPDCDTESCRHFPIHDASHVRAALSAIKGGRSGKIPEFAKEAKPKICAAAKKFEINSTVCGEGETSETMTETEEPAEGLVECMRVRAQVTEDNLALTKKLELSENVITVKSEEIATLEETLAEKERLLASTDETKAQLSETMNDLAKERADHKSTQGTVKAMKESASREKARIAVKDSEIERLSEDVGNLDQNVVNLRTKLSESLERTASSNQKATNETRERSRIQTDNADLREKVASLTREISDLTEARSIEAKTIMAGEQRMSDLIKEMQGRNARIGELQDTIGKAKQFHKWAWEQLKQAGYMAVNKD